MATFVSMATCHTCNKTSKLAGPNRDFLATLGKKPSTPRNEGKRKSPQSNSKGSASTPSSATRQKTPFSTPRTVSSNTSSSSKSSSSIKKSAFSRLKKLLMLEDSTESKKGGLKDFLSAL